MLKHASPTLARRQLWNFPSDTSTTVAPHCTPFALPSNGVISIGDSSAITLTTDVIFQPQCTGTSTGEVFNIGYLKEPFYASTTPMIYVIAAATVIAWILVVMLTITPRTNFFGLPVTAPAFNNGHGVIGGASGGTSSGISGSGSRPWLQKAATLFVAIALTIATADTLEAAERQYYSGYMDANDLRKEVMGSLEIRITRVVSDIFVWLAQVQTLVRLFPRHKEKVMIKWIGFVLIMLDTIFSCLNSFLPGIASYHDKKFVDAIPALSYLFELALGLLYAAWVMYYSVTKRRYAFYHPKMRSISLIALLSLLAILTPVVFFVTDVTNGDVAGWGDYFRWVGAAAASVVVWEWVERIEALERDDKKDGILGREVFDGDEMLDVMPSENEPWSQSRNLRRNFRPPGFHDDGTRGNQSRLAENGLSGMASRFRSRHQQSPQHFPLGRAHSSSEANTSYEHPQQIGRAGHITFEQRARPAMGGPTPPVPTASPVNRADTTSAASTVYVVRHDNIAADVPQPIRRRINASRNPPKQSKPKGSGQRPDSNELNEKDFISGDDEAQPNRDRQSGRWHTVMNPFKRKRTSPPQEVQRAQASDPVAHRATTPAHNFSKWDIKNRLGVLAAETGDRFREKNARHNQQADLPVTVIPAQPRGSGRTWSPDEHGLSDATTPKPERPSGDQPSSGSGTSTTLVADGPDPQSELTPQPGAVVNHAQHPGTTASPSSWSGPPRADDVSPPAGSSGNGGIVVVPAPPRRSPHQNTSVGGSRLGSPASGSGPDSRRNTPANG